MGSAPGRPGAAELDDQSTLAGRGARAACKRVANEATGTSISKSHRIRKLDVPLARLVRQAAPEAILWADANGGYDLATALEVAPQLADAGVDVLEAPLRPNQLSGYQALRRQKALPIFMDEGVISTVELDEFIRLEMLDGVAMKPARCGGLASAKRRSSCCARGLAWLGSGLTDPDISLAATLGLYAAFGLQRPPPSTVRNF